ncbi:unnamed protein product [Haemonchus placei]|uniref:RNase H domain-containing protein n=1 Tax=Haemonchus placei TaxID=6290 RepID=A0A0N4XBR9_HAEPC|nr:unnamed protein product [Haemonchus placei]
MNPRDNLSNSATVNKNIAECDQPASIEIKVLGMQWNAVEDIITLQCIEKQANKTSKRTVLSQINGYCYDPLGLLTPLMVPAKIFLQDVHKQSELAQKSCGKERDQQSYDINIRGQLQEGVRLQYLRNNDVLRRHQRDKAFHREVKSCADQTNIPRLELLSIFLGLSLAESTMNKVDIMFEKVNLFSDSTIALCWIQGYRRLPTMVTTLVRKIGLIAKRIRDTSNVTFYHVPTHENIADFATREVTKNGIKCHRWWSGPIWLNTTTDCWPAKDATNLR